VSWTSYKLNYGINFFYFSFMQCLFFSSTFIATFVKFDEKSKSLSIWRQILECFSIKSNLKSLLSVEHEKSSITCLNGLRVISILFIILYHCVQFRFQYPFANGELLSAWNDTMFMKSMSSVTIFVDMFFIMSGLLVARSVLRGLNR
jgi:hypothetical protein